jgi:hypothetical protein
MKQFIVLLAVFPLMMAFMMQFAAQQNTDYRIQMINETVHNACEKAKTEGRFTDSNVAEIKNKLADISECSTDSIKVNVSKDMKYRTGSYDEREMIEYRIEVPINGIVAFPQLFGISKDDNSMMYVIENEFASERLM